MKNTILSITLFLIVVFLVFFANKELITLCSEITNESIEIEELLDNEDFDKAYDKSVKLLDILKNESFIATMYINHTDIDDILSQLVRLTVLIKSEDKSESLATLHVIKYNSERIKSLQELSPENIF